MNYTLFNRSNISMSNARLNLAKNQLHAKQHPDAELYPRYHSRIIGHIPKNKQKNNGVCGYEIYD